MSCKFTDLQCREVICIGSGRRLGFIRDVLVEVPQGNVTAIVVPAPGTLMGLAGRREDYIIPWDAIRRIGPDIVLVDMGPEDCRVPRRKQGTGFLFRPPK